MLLAKPNADIEIKTMHYFKYLDILMYPQAAMAATAKTINMNVHNQWSPPSKIYHVPSFLHELEIFCPVLEHWSVFAILQPSSKS